MLLLCAVCRGAAKAKKRTKKNEIELIILKESEHEPS